MAHTFTCLHLHIVFSTKNRAPLITGPFRQHLFPYMGGIIRQMECTPLLINGVDDHVHILTSLSPKIALSDFMKELKSVSSGWAKSAPDGCGDFGWQTGYAAFSVSKSKEKSAHHYIATQEDHHRRISFQQEYLALLKKHEIPYDPRFVFEMEIAG